MRFTAIIFAVVPAITSAWKLELFEKRNQGGDIIYTLSGTLDHDCRNLPAGAQNRARSYRWDSDGFLADDCAVILYKETGCNERLFSSGAADINDNLVGGSDKNVESFKVDC